MLANFDPYYVLARELGLHISPAGGPGLFDTGIHVNGTFEGRIVAIRRHIGRGPFVAFRAPLDPALDLGLSIRPSVMSWDVMTVSCSGMAPRSPERRRGGRAGSCGSLGGSGRHGGCQRFVGR